MLPSLDEKLVGVEALRIFLLLNELLHVIQRNKQRQSTELAVMVAAAIRRLSEESLHVIGRQLCGLFIFVINRPQLISPILRQRGGGHQGRSRPNNSCDVLFVLVIWSDIKVYVSP